MSGHTTDSLFSPRSVLILGSGFSRSFCSDMPTLAHLSAILAALLSTAPDRYPELADLLSQLSRIDRIQIEKAVSLIFSDGPYPNTTERLLFATMQQQFLHWLAQEIRSSQQSFNSDPVLQRTISALATSDPDTQPRIVSLNYDTIIETQLRDMASSETDGAHWESTFPVQLQTLPTSRTIGGGKARNCFLPLLKIHGSIDWFKMPGSDSNDVNNVVHVSDPSSREYQILSAEPPVHIPMSHARSQFLKGSLFPLLWQHMLHTLDQADSIHFIGYGFPETDAVFQYQIQKGRVP